MLVILTGCSGSAAIPLGPDSGAGCDRSIFGHCPILPGDGPWAAQFGGPACVEFSGPVQNPSHCPVFSSLSYYPGYEAGPCPRDMYNASCVERALQAADAGGCEAFETFWGISSDWTPGVVGLPGCLPQ